ncbi:MAG: hypothetical protein ACRECR_04595 [Thermoplasmata archaeon]
MTARGGGPVPSIANRCRCGHLPVDHMEVRPAVAGRLGAFALFPGAPCFRCAGACPRFTPSF